MDPVYMDYNATTPVHPRVTQVIESMCGKAEEIAARSGLKWGNPSSSHVFGEVSKKELEKSRATLRKFLNAKEGSEVVFTSGGTESINHALKAVAFSRLHTKRKLILTSTIEHVAVLETLKYLEFFGFKFVKIPVDSRGIVDLSFLERTLKTHSDEVCLVSIMYVNNVIGTIQPLKEISDLISELECANEVFLHTDACQAACKIVIDVEVLGVDMLSISGQKMYATKGCGLLYIKDRSNLKHIMSTHRLLHGATNQENGYRSSTEAVVLCAALAASVELFMEDTDAFLNRCRYLRNILRDSLVSEATSKNIDFHINCAELSDDLKLPNTLSIGFDHKGWTASSLIASFSDSLCCSAGSACHSGSDSISYVLKAIDLEERYAKCTLRLSVGRFTTENDIKQAVQSIINSLILN